MKIKQFSKQLKEKYGKMQLIVAIEELSELQKELTKYIRGKSDREHLIEEIADVQLMIDELKEYFNISQISIYRMKRKKIIRTQKRLLDNEEAEEEKGMNLFDFMEEQK